MHADSLAKVKKQHDGEIPKSWLTGDTAYQKAAVLAAVAWHEVKDTDLPELTDADITFREQCIGIAESIMRDNLPDSTPFATRVLALWKQTAEYGAAHPSNSKELAHVQN